MEGELVSVLLVLWSALAGATPSSAGREGVVAPGPLQLPDPGAGVPVAVRSRGRDALRWHARPEALHGTAPGEVELILEVPTGLRVYRDSLQIRVLDSDGLIVGPADVPPGHLGVTHPDLPARAHFDGDVVVRLPVRSIDGTPGLAQLGLRVHHQGCFEGRCLRPVERILQVHVPVRPHRNDAPGEPRNDAPPGSPAAKATISPANDDPPTCAGDPAY